MSYLLGVDIETTGVDQKKDVIIEIGMVIVDTSFSDKGAKYIPVDIFNKLINCPNRPPMHPEAYEITHITEEMLQKWGTKPDKRFCEHIASYFNKCDYVVACNGNRFDRPMLEKFFKQFDSELPEKIWIDTQKDVPHHDAVKQRNQTYVAGYYGTVNNIPHRSCTDVLMLFKLLGAYDREGDLFPLETIIKNATAKKIKIAALVSFDDKDQAKSDKFKWDGDGKDCGKTKTWWKEINEEDYNPENYIFETEILAEMK